MVPDTTPAVLETVTSFLALTTPFELPPNCESHWSSTREVTYRDNTRGTFPALVSQHVASCYPPGWEGAVLSPAVCPSGWTYYEMGEYGVSRTRTTATCCNSGYTFQNDGRYNAGPGRCTRWVTCTDKPANSSDDAPPNTAELAETLLIHGPWVVEWAASDTSTLTPKLPTLTNSMLVPTWTPGEIIPDRIYDRQPTQETGTLKGFGRTLLLAIGVPILSALFLAALLWAMIRNIPEDKKSSEQQTTGDPSERTVGVVEK